MKSKLGIVLGSVLVLGLSTSAFARGNTLPTKGNNGKQSNPQFPAPAPAEWYGNECSGIVSVEWTGVVSNQNGSAPTKYASQIVQTLRASCPDGAVIGTQVDNFTVPGNTTEFDTPIGLLLLGQICGPEDVTVLVKALNPPGRSQNNPQALAENGGFGTVTCF